MCLPADSSVLNLLCLFEYLDTMVIGAIAIVKAGKRSREREHPKHQGCVTSVSILSWQCYLSCPPHTDLSPGNVRAVLTHFYSLGLERRNAALGI